MSQNKKEEVKEIEVDIPENPQDIPECVPKKGRGRPAGAKNKAKPKPKPKPKPKAKKAQRPIEYHDEEEDDEYPEEEIPPTRRRRPEGPGGHMRCPRVAVQPSPELDRRALAADVLSILQEQRYQKTSARRNHYASWFENM